MCKHYGRFGHEENNCFEIIGYPPGWGPMEEEGAKQGDLVVAKLVETKAEGRP